MLSYCWSGGRSARLLTQSFHICSSVLPIPFAFSKMGVLVGLLTMAIVAGSNCLTSTILLEAALKSGNASYEGIAEAAGGRAWKVWMLTKNVINRTGSLTCCLP